MSNPIKQRPLEPILGELVQMGAQANGPLFIAFRDLITRADKTTDNNGQIQAQANVSGRTDQLGTTLQNVDSAGTILPNGVDFTRAYINKSIANVPETSNLKYRTAAHSTSQPTNISITGTDSGGGHAQAAYGSFTQRVPGLSDYSIPAFLATGLLNATTYYMYIDDTNFDGTGTAFLTTDQNAVFSSPSRMYLGTVTTPAGGAGPTTGKAGGNGGGVNRATVLN